MSSKARVAVFWTILICVAGTLWMIVAGRHPEPKITYSQFLASVESGQVASVTIMSSSSGAFPAVCRLKDGNTVRTVLPAAFGDALRAMQEKLVSVEIRDASSEPLRLLINMTPFLVLLGFWFFMYRKLRNGPRQGLWG
jgi:cell division protease FtsH